MPLSRLVSIVVTLTSVAIMVGCAPAERPDPSPASSGPATYGDGPVTLLVDGTDDGTCDWQLLALYPRDTAPHAVDMRVVYVDKASGRELTMSGTAEYFPNSDHVSRTPEGELVESELFGWSERLPCSQIQANIEIKACLEGSCPDYIAGESRIPMSIKLMGL